MDSEPSEIKKERFFIEVSKNLAIEANIKQVEYIDGLDNNSFFILKGNRLKKSSIRGIWDERTYYEMYPERRQEPRKRLELPKPSSKRGKEESQAVKLWRECLLRNKKLISQGKLPCFVVKDNEIVQKEYYWR